MPGSLQPSRCARVSSSYKVARRTVSRALQFQRGLILATTSSATPSSYSHFLRYQRGGLGGTIQLTSEKEREEKKWRGVEGRREGRTGGGCFRCETSQRASWARQSQAGPTHGPPVSSRAHWAVHLAGPAAGRCSPSSLTLGATHLSKGSHAQKDTRNDRLAFCCPRPLLTPVPPQTGARCPKAT